MWDKCYILVQLGVKMTMMVNRNIRILFAKSGYMGIYLNLSDLKVAFKHGP